MKKHILVVEDESTLGEMICDVLRDEGHEVRWEQRGDRALAALGDDHVDLVLLDLMLPELDGLEVLTRMRNRGDETPVLILSARSSTEDRIRGLELKADDYLGKPFDRRELILRAAALLKRTEPPTDKPEVLRFMGHTVDLRAHEAQLANGETERLSGTEVKLLRLLAGRPGDVITRQEIVRVLFGPHTPSTHRTVDNVLLRLRSLFEVDGRNPQTFLTVRGVGLRFLPAPDSAESAEPVPDRPTQ